MGVSNMKLVKIGAFGGIATVTMGFLAYTKLMGKIKGQPYYKEALQTLRQHQGAVYLLGEPIKVKSVDLSDPDRNYFEENSAHMEIDVKGPKQKGVLYCWAERDAEKNWRVHRIELGLANEPNRRLLIRKSL